MTLDSNLCKRIIEYLLKKAIDQYIQDMIQVFQIWLNLYPYWSGFCRIGPMAMNRFDYIKANKSRLINIIVLLRDVFHIGLVICNFNHQILPYGILFLPFICTNVFLFTAI